MIRSAQLGHASSAPADGARSTSEARRDGPEFSRVGSNQRGIGLFEVLAGSLVATLAVLGLAYSFGIGRGLIDRYQVARMAMSRAQLAIDSLGAVPSASLVDGSESFWVPRLKAGTTSWIIEWVDDPADGLSTSAPSDPNPNDLKRITVEVEWSLGGTADKLHMSRMRLP